MELPINLGWKGVAGASGNGEPGVDRPDKFLTGKAIFDHAL